MCDYFVVRKEDDNFYGFHEPGFFPLTDRQADCIKQCEKNQGRKIRIYRLVEVVDEN